MESTSQAIERAARAVREGNGDPQELVAALLRFRQDPEPEQERAEERPAWEYRTELLEYGLFGWGKQQVDLQKVQERLDALGAEGWELVQVSWDHRVRRRHGGHLLFFKRPQVERSASG